MTEVKYSGTENDEGRAEGEFQPSPPGILLSLEQLAILDALEGNGYLIGRAAKELGVTRQTIYNHLRRWGMEKREPEVRKICDKVRRELAGQAKRRV
jgi:predicted transcriptional regulator